MKRICPGCGIKSNSSSAWCPYCGSQMYPRIPWVTIVWIGVAIIVLVLIVMVLMSVQVAGVKHRT